MKRWGYCLSRQLTGSRPAVIGGATCRANYAPGHAEGPVVVGRDMGRGDRPSESGDVAQIERESELIASPRRAAPPTRSELWRATSCSGAAEKASNPAAFSGLTTGIEDHTRSAACTRAIWGSSPAARHGRPRWTPTWRSAPRNASSATEDGIAPEKAPGRRRFFT